MEWLILCALFTLVVALIIILVKYGDHENIIYRERLPHQPEQDLRKMVSVSPVKLPFSVELVQQQDSALVISIKGSKKCLVSCHACVNIRELQKAVEEKKYTESRRLVDILNLISVWGSEEEQVILSEDGYIHKVSYASMPTNVQNDFASFSDNYEPDAIAPLILRIRLTDDECESLSGDNDVLTMLTVFKVSNDSMPNSPKAHHNTPTAPPLENLSPCGSSNATESRPIALKLRTSDQYIETVNCRVFHLKKLYKSGVDRIDDVPTSPPPDPGHPNAGNGPGTPEDEYCLVCQENPVTRALLPCRHLCTCKACFAKLDLCPICRLKITSFFVVKSEENIPDVVQQREESSDDLNSLIQNEGIWSFIKSIWNAS